MLNKNNVLVLLFIFLFSSTTLLFAETNQRFSNPVPAQQQPAGQSAGSVQSGQKIDLKVPGARSEQDVLLQNMRNRQRVQQQGQQQQQRAAQQCNTSFTDYQNMKTRVAQETDECFKEFFITHSTGILQRLGLNCQQGMCRGDSCDDPMEALCRSSLTEAGARIMFDEELEAQPAGGFEVHPKCRAVHDIEQHQSELVFLQIDFCRACVAQGLLPDGDPSVSVEEGFACEAVLRRVSENR